jgi:nucleoside-diphosphate-sugar epimerase
LDPVETADINVHGTVNVFEAARRANVKKVIYAESSALYEGSSVLPTPETEVKPQSFYSISKLATMYFAEAYSRFFNLNSTALRYFCVYGPRQDYRRTIPPLFSAFIIKLLKGEQPVIYGNGEKRRDFIHVDDINEFHIQCMQDGRTTGKVFNLGSGMNYSVNEIYNIIAKLLKSEIKPEYKQDLPGEALANLADITLAKSLGWNPKISLEEGLRSSIEFIKSELGKGKI